MPAACGPCGNATAITDASTPLINNFGTNSKLGPALNMLLRALDQVDIRQRAEVLPATWKPTQFPAKGVPYGQKPEGTEVISKNTPIYFVDNEPYAYDFHVSGPEGGICEGNTLCGEPPANKVPGDTFQTFTWRMKGTAWETPIFCLKDLLFYENGIEYLTNFLKNVERTPSDFYTNYIRNLIWETGEKYGLAETSLGLMWNSPDRVSARVAPNFQDFVTLGGASTDFAMPKMVALQYLKYILEQFYGSDLTGFNVDGGQTQLMLVGTEPDMFSVFYNDTDVSPANWAQGGMGFNMFTFQTVPKLPFVFKNDPDWFRGDFDADGEFHVIPAKVYVPQNGGADLRVNPEWLTAKYGVMTFMTAKPFYYRQFDNLPSMPSQVDPSATRWLRPRFTWVPLLEKCNYSRGLVQWRAEDEFGFQPTGEKIIHVIYRRDGLGSYLRAAKSSVVIASPTMHPAAIPETCGSPQVLGCCAVAGIVSGGQDYRDTTYSVTYDGDIITALGLNVSGLPGTPVSAKFQTAKGIFTVKIFATNASGTIVNFGVLPSEHVGGHFCCTDQLIGLLGASATAHKFCQALLDGGLSPTAFDPTLYVGHMSHALDAVADDVVAVFFDSGCGGSDYIEMTVDTIDNSKRRIFLTVDPTDFPDGVNCNDAVKVCAFNSNDCQDCLNTDATDCDADDVTPIDDLDDDHVES